MDDILRSLGHLCLGSRLKRLGEQLQAETQKLLDEVDPDIQSGHHQFLAALARLGPLTIGELAQALGVSQPGVTRMVARLVELGFAEIRTAPQDQRQRIVHLGAKGRKVVETASADVWPRIEKAVEALCDGTSGPLLKQLAEIEDGLAAWPLSRRASDLKEQPA